MNKGITLLIAAGIVSSQAAVAEKSALVVTDESGQQIAREEIREALMILLENGALKISEDYRSKVDRDLIDELRRGGLIKKSGGETSSICIDPTE